MNNSDLIDQLVDRIQQLKDMMESREDNFEMDAFLVQSIADHGDEAMLLSVIEDVERLILQQDNDEPINY